MKFKKADLFFIILLLLLTIISLDLLINVEHQKLLTNIWYTAPFRNISTGLLITFIVCTVGNLLQYLRHIHGLCAAVSRI